MGTAGVAAGHPATVDVGMSILDRGGSAADAAVAAVLAACVAETIMTGLGGGGFATHYDAERREVTCWDFFVAIPGMDGQGSAALRPVEVHFGGVPLEFAVGAASVAVPGVPAGCEVLHRAFGRLSWPHIVAPAIALADAGVPLPPRHAEALRDLSAALLAGDGASAYAPRGGLLTAGQSLRHPGLAETLRIIARRGATDCYRGELAERMVAAVRAEGGSLSAGDLAAYRVRRLPVRTVGFAGFSVAGRDDLLHTPDTLANIDVSACFDPVKRAPVLAQALAAVPDRTLGDTTNVTAVDAQGNACVITTTLGLGSGIWPAGTGIHLNSMLGEGELRSDSAIVGQRMGSMMSPLVVIDPATGRLRLALGAAGASRIRSALTHTLVHELIDGDDAVRAIARPRFHPVGRTVHCEYDIDHRVCEALTLGGFRPTVATEVSHYFGGVSAVDTRSAAGDPRRDGTGRLQ